MLKLDNNLLDELGLGSLPADQKRTMLQHIYETLELRVGTQLANQMTDQQLQEFEKFIDEGGDTNQAQALQWLETNLPNYKQVVNDVFEALKIEIRQMAPQLVASSGAVPQQSIADAPVQPQVQAAPPQPQAMSPTTMPPQAPPQVTTDRNQPYPASYQSAPAAPPAPPAPQPQFPAGQPAPQPFQPPVAPDFPAQQPPAGPGA